MAKATIAVAVLALALLLTGPAAAAQAGRRLMQGANAGAQSGGFTTGNPSFAQAGGFDQAATFKNPFAAAGAAGGAGYSVAIENGKPSISASVGEGTTASFKTPTGAQSQSQANSNSFTNGIPGTGAFTNINVGSNFGGAATQAIANSKSVGK